MEAEYIALSTSMRSLIPLKTLVEEVAASLMEDSTFLTNTYSSAFEGKMEPSSLQQLPEELLVLNILLFLTTASTSMSPVAAIF